MPKKIPYHKPRHVPSAAKLYESQPFRIEARSFYNGQRWRDLRVSFLLRSPLCVRCQGQGVSTLATVVDHIQERRDRPDLAYDESNLQPLCASCHNSKRRK
jgi:5-methylcytosine-specific restriction enzyme A